MAAAFAATVKAREKDMPIAILHHGSALSSLSPKELDLFDLTIWLSDKHVTNKDGSFNPIKARLYFYDLTPFEETLAIDVDNAWLRKKSPTMVFDELADVNFTIQNAGHTVCDENASQYYSVWAEIQSVIEGYSIKDRKFYRTYGEWIYFKKSPEAKKLFAAAKKAFNQKPKADVIDGSLPAQG